MRRKLLSLLLAGALVSSLTVLPAVAKSEAQPSSCQVTFNGQLVELPAYLYRSNNYIKLRDLAQLLSGTSAQFEVGWSQKSVMLTSGQSYTPVGGELSGLTTGKAYHSNSILRLNGAPLAIRGINVGNTNYFKLRDLAAVLDFGVGWDQASHTVTIDTSVDYEEPARGTSGLNTYPMTMLGRTFGDLAKEMSFVGTEIRDGMVATFSYHGNRIYLNFSEMPDEPGGTIPDSAICCAISAPLRCYVNNCPASLTLDQAAELFGGIKFKDEPDMLCTYITLQNGYLSPVLERAMGNRGPIRQADYLLINGTGLMSDPDDKYTENPGPMMPLDQPTKPTKPGFDYKKYVLGDWDGDVFAGHLKITRINESSLTADFTPVLYQPSGPNDYSPYYAADHMVTFTLSSRDGKTYSGKFGDKRGVQYEGKVVLDLNHLQNGKGGLKLTVDSIGTASGWEVMWANGEMRKK